MSASSEEGLEEPLRHRVIWQPRDFEERRLFDIENPREFQEKHRLAVEAFEYLLSAVGEHLEQINFVQLELTHVVYKRIQVMLQWPCF